MSDEKFQPATWVVANYAGERAKSVMAHAEHGIGYLILESGGAKSNPSILAAFRFAGPWPLPPQLQEVKDAFKVQEYNRRLQQRQGGQKRKEAPALETISIDTILARKERVVT